jgi:hypothetical protein
MIFGRMNKQLKDRNKSIKDSDKSFNENSIYKLMTLFDETSELLLKEKYQL